MRKPVSHLILLLAAGGPLAAVQVLPTTPPTQVPAQTPNQTPTVGPNGGANDYPPDDGGLGMLGVRTWPPPVDAMVRSGLEPGQGMMVYRVRPGSPAEQMGIRPGDIITSVNGQETGRRQQLRGAIISHQPGDAAEVTVNREGNTATLDGTFGERPARWGVRPMRFNEWEQQYIDNQAELLAIARNDLDAAKDEASALNQSLASAAASLALAEADAFQVAARERGDRAWRLRFLLHGLTEAAAAIPAADATPIAEDPAAAAADAAQIVPTSVPWRLNLSFRSPDA